MKNKKYFINIAIILIIGGVSIYLSIGQQFDQVIHAFQEAKIYWIIVMAVVMFSYYLFDALSLLYFGKAYKHDYTFKQSFVNAISGTFFNGITPFASGGQFAQVYIFNKQGIPPTNSASILLMCFICYQSVLVIYTGIVLLMKYNYFVNEQPGVFSLAILGFFINFAVILGLFGGAKSKRLQNFLTHTVLKFLSKIHIVKDYELTCIKIEQYLSDFREQLKFLQKNRQVLVRSCLCNFVKLTIIYSMPFFAAKALNLNVSWSSFFDYLGLCSFIYLINAFLPIPGASGGSEGVYVLLFSFLGSVGTSSSLFLWRFMSYYLGLIIGGLVFSLNKEINNSRLE
ncbi:lysylphosphatidylglycerol synthase transmembrane domain-containing protein [Candidatus Stoquefichus massiliensis]|uniref:lysylphosphatidylglycerol synthase transmembrane domain-containing protein n=1 Tax=Candidatus Stoquefichus massiliensis TaxID=1470350 RepID=UPI000487CBFE|nr:lysylphosphatidylglycerol synthase transmembrane domain-containing protein [Candidatus Stoquefichus massiliensis]